ncbi:hypothetical protein [Leisingera daeponensis]|uniref:hypothetical protein n=1 Tax=Leisingera daeponensis TaxID=405746 RepID=UPI001C9430B1|nr:hypothetical protein [Leisingera daeponensis]MBY6055368.1 hypothetical protein [Leisingera daeponensis]
MSDTDNPEWPREIWMAELDEHHNGTGMVVLSVSATVPRWEGDDERDCDFQKYVDADILDTTERYYEAKLEEMRARIKALRGWIEDEAADRGEADAEYETHRQCSYALSEL